MDSMGSHNLELALKQIRRDRYETNKAIVKLGHELLIMSIGLDISNKAIETVEEILEHAKSYVRDYENRSNASSGTNSRFVIKDLS